MNDVRSWLALKSIPGVGNRLFLSLIHHFGEPGAVLGSRVEALRQVNGVGGQLASAIANYQIPQSVDDDLALINDKGLSIVTLYDENYPALLKQIYDPPPLIYVCGRIRPATNNIAVVGSRNATRYGLEIAKNLSRDLAQQSLVVVSGMARGIDSAAHWGALRAGGETIAVLGCGLGTIYPSENKELFQEISRQGAVISEFPVLTMPEPYRFPIRNRIISGLSLGTVVVEAAQRSGSLITANIAAEQGREVFAVPGSVNSFKSIGTHALIKQGAKLVESVEDIIEELNLGAPAQNITAKKSEAVALGPQEEMILDKLGPYPVHIDELIQQLPLNASEVSSLLLQMELKGQIIQAPGKLFARHDSLSRTCTVKN